MPKRTLQEEYVEVSAGVANLMKRLRMTGADVLPALDNTMAAFAMLGDIIDPNPEKPKVNEAQMQDIQLIDAVAELEKETDPDRQVLVRTIQTLLRGCVVNGEYKVKKRVKKCHTYAELIDGLQKRGQTFRLASAAKQYAVLTVLRAS